VTLTAEELASWTPIRVVEGGDDLHLDWCHTAGLTFAEPFFAQTIGVALAHPFRVLFRHDTTLAEAEQLVGAAPGLPIAGFVFHLSRCGSTLVMQMLAATGRVLALSEPGPLDMVLRRCFDQMPATDDDRVRWFRVVAGALAQPRSASQRHCVVKLDAWSVLDLELVRRAFPSVPWIFLHREPTEVLASHQRHAGFHMRPGSLGPATLGVDPPPADTSEYGAFVLGRILAAAADGADDRHCFVGYDELPGAVADVIAPHFGLPLDDADCAAMAAAAARDAKDPSRPYSPRDLPPNDFLHLAVDRWTRPAYERVLASGR
jgi:gluconate kinase